MQVMSRGTRLRADYYKIRPRAADPCIPASLLLRAVFVLLYHAFTLKIKPCFCNNEMVVMQGRR